MGHYKSNLRDIEFNLYEVFGADKDLGTGPFSQLDLDSAKDVLREVERLATNDLAASFIDSDRNPPVFDPETSTVTVPVSLSNTGGLRSLSMKLSARSSVARRSTSLSTSRALSLSSSLKGPCPSAWSAPNTSNRLNSMSRRLLL